MVAQAEWYGPPDTRTAPLYPYAREGESYEAGMASDVHRSHRHMRGYSHASARRGIIRADRRLRRADRVDTTVGSGRKNAAERRVIRADAEITIVGPDRMTIKLLRKRRGSRAEMPASE